MLSVASVLPADTRGWEAVPGVIRNDGVDSFRVEVNTNGPVAGVTIQPTSSSLVAPASLVLRDDGLQGDRVAGDSVYTSGAFRYNMAAAMPSTYQYDPASPAGLHIVDVGTVTIQEPGGSSSQFLVGPKVGVLRSDIAAVATLARSADVVTSPHLINVRTETMATQRFLRESGNDLVQLTGTIYQTLPDAFDFFTMFSTNHVEKLPRTAYSNFAAGTHLAVRTAGDGIGAAVYNDVALYGSSGRLMGINVIDAADRGIWGANATHELLHQWSAYLDPSLGVTDGTGHFANNSNAASLVGGFEWVDNGDGTFMMNRDEGRNGSQHASPLDKYLMGLVDASAVPPIHVFDASKPLPSDGQVIAAADITRTVTVQDIIGAHGVRSPIPAAAQRSFNLAFVAESHDRLLTPTEMTFYEILAEHYTKSLPTSSPDPYIGAGWQPITRFFGENTTWSSSIPADSTKPDIRMQSVTADGFTRLTLQYEIAAAATAPFEIGMYRSADANYSKTDLLLGSVQITAPVDRAIGPHTIQVTIGSGAGQIPLPGAGADQVDSEYYLLAVADAADQIAETDATPFAEDNRATFVGVYHPAKGRVLVHGRPQSDVVTISGSPIRVTLNGTTFTYTDAEVTGVRVWTYAGNDTINGAASQKLMRVFAGAGNDVILGGVSNDLLSGGSGDDLFRFDADAVSGRDTLWETSGSDTIDFSLTTAQAVTVDLSATAAQSVNGYLTLVLASGLAFENVIGGSKHDRLTGNALNNILVGLSGTDTLFGMDGRDLLIGGAGADSLTGGLGEDIIVGARTVYDQNQAAVNLTALKAIIREWARSDVGRAARIDHLQSGGGLNGSYFLGPTKLAEDQAADSVFGNSADDWCLTGPGDTISE